MFFYYIAQEFTLNTFQHNCYSSLKKEKLYELLLNGSVNCPQKKKKKKKLKKKKIKKKKKKVNWLFHSCRLGIEYLLPIPHKEGKRRPHPHGGDMASLEVPGVFLLLGGMGMEDDVGTKNCLTRPLTKTFRRWGHWWEDSV